MHAHTPSPDDSVFDRAAALERVGGDEQLLREIAGICLDECPALLADIQAAVARKDGVELRRAAHTLKGSMAVFGADAVHEAAWGLEQAGRDGDWGAAGPGLAALESRLGRFLPAMAALAGRAAAGESP